MAEWAFKLKQLESERGTLLVWEPNTRCGIT